MIQDSRFRSRNQKGQSLLEVLIVIGVLVIVATFATQLIFVALRGNQIVGERDAALRVAEEAMDAVFAISIDRWDDIYPLTKGTTPYYTTQSMGQWSLSPGTTVVALNGVDYTLAVSFQNVCRVTGGGITGLTNDVAGMNATGETTNCSVSGGNHDPTSQQATVNVTWGNSGNVTIREIVFRWRNEVCPQTSWSSANPGGGPTECTTVEYDNASDIQTGDTLEVQ